MSLLDDALAEHARLTREYVRLLHRHAAVSPRPRRGHSGLAVMAVLAVALCAVWLGGTPVSALRVGSSPVAEPGALGGGGAPAVDCGAANVVCIGADSGSRLNVSTSNKIYDGQGHTVAGVIVNASGVTVQNFKFANCAGYCVWTKGTGNTVQDNDISQVYYDTSVSDDIDALRFFGNGTKILRNKMHDILVGTDEHGAHLDCMQTYATPSAGGGSSDVLIQGNDCRSSHFHQCVMAEGPDSQDGGGGGGGVSKNWNIDSNYFECHATGQTVKLDDIHDSIVQRNIFAGTGNVAVAVTSLSSNVTVKSDNTLGPGYGALVGN